MCARPLSSGRRPTLWSNEALMALHVQAMFTCTDKGALLTVNEPWDGSRPAPLLFVGIPEGSPPLCWGRADLPASLVAAVRSLTEQEPLPVSALEKLLGKPLAAEPTWQPRGKLRRTDARAAVGVHLGRIFLAGGGTSGGLPLLCLLCGQRGGSRLSKRSEGQRP